MLAIIIGGLAIILAIPGMLIAFLLAFVITYLFKPIITVFERRGVSKTFAILIPFIFGGLAFSAASQFVVNRVAEQTTSLETDLPRYISGVSTAMEKHTNTLSTALKPYTKVDIAERAGVWMKDSVSNIIKKIPEWVSTLLATMILAPFFAFFMLKDGQRVSRRLLSLFPNNVFEMALNLTYQINKKLGGFIRARLFESVIVGIVVWLGLYALGFPYTSILAVFAGLTNLIPYLGPIIGAVPGIVIAYGNNNSFAPVALAIMVYVIAQLIDMLFVIPFVVAKIVDLHPVTVVVVVIIGSQVMGIMGMIISVPLASILKLVFTEVYNHVVDFRS